MSPCRSQSVNRISFKDKFDSYKKRPLSFMILISIWFSAIVLSATVIILVGYILIKGLPHITPSLFDLIHKESPLFQLGSKY